MSLFIVIGLCLPEMNIHELSIDGLLLGVVQGYLMVPSFLTIPIAVRHILAPWKRWPNLLLMRYLAVVMVFLFILLGHVSIAIALLRSHGAPSYAGQWWRVGAFLGGCLYAVVPSLESALRRRRR